MLAEGALAGEVPGEEAQGRAARRLAPGRSRRRRGGGRPLRRGEGGPHRFLASLAEAWVRGVAVDWQAAFASGPARAGSSCRHTRSSASGSGSQAQRRRGRRRVGGAGAAEHPLLGAGVALADERGWLFTGRLSLRSHPWLADHAVTGVVLLPGTALLELALHAGRRVGCERVRELTLEAPLGAGRGGGGAAPGRGGGARRSGRRAVDVHSRMTGVRRWAVRGGGVDAQRRRAARSQGGGRSGREGPRRVGQPRRVGRRARRRGVAAGRRRRGGGRGPLRASRGGGLRLRPGVSVSAGCVAAGGGAVRGGVAVRAAAGAGASTACIRRCWTPRYTRWPRAGSASRQRRRGRRRGRALPFAWSGVSLLAAGASVLRVHLAASGDGGVSLRAVDDDGAGVLSARSLALRPTLR